MLPRQSTTPHFAPPEQDVSHSVAPLHATSHVPLEHDSLQSALPHFCCVAPGVGLGPGTLLPQAIAKRTTRSFFMRRSVPRQPRTVAITARAQSRSSFSETTAVTKSNRSGLAICASTRQ